MRGIKCKKSAALIMGTAFDHSSAMMLATAHKVLRINRVRFGKLLDAGLPRGGLAGACR